MSKICFPHYTKGDFDSLDEAVKYLSNSLYGWSKYLLCNIVQYNVCYRDHLREFGIDSLMKMLAEEAPRLDESSFSCLRQWWDKVQTIADYDIQCYNIKDCVTILGHTFKGLEDVTRHAEIVASKILYGYDCFTPKDFDVYDDVHVGKIYDSYPIFDSSDSSDNRTYQNYIFRANPVTKEDMNEAFKIPCGDNYRRVHEEIPVAMLPVLYYEGDGEYMLLAAAKG